MGKSFNKPSQTQYAKLSMSFGQAATNECRHQNDDTGQPGAFASSICSTTTPSARLLRSNYDDQEEGGHAQEQLITIATAVEHPEPQVMVMPEAVEVVPPLYPCHPSSSSVRSQTMRAIAPDFDYDGNDENRLFGVEAFVEQPPNIEVFHQDRFQHDEETQSDSPADIITIVRKWKTSCLSEVGLFAIIWNLFLVLIVVSLMNVDCDAPNVTCSGDPEFLPLLMIPFVSVGIIFLYREVRFQLNSTILCINPSTRCITISEKPIPSLCCCCSINNKIVTLKPSHRLLYKATTTEKVNDQPVFVYDIVAVDTNQIRTKLLSGTVTQRQDALFIIQELEHYLGIKERLKEEFPLFGGDELV